VCGFERFRNLLRDGEGVIDRQRAAGDPLRQILAVDEFHHERADVPTLFEAVDLRDVRVIQRGQRLRFPSETRHALRIMRERIGEDFERHVAIESRVARPINLPHAAGTECTNDFVQA
jgi:hypothetical protein